jgi:hypothetical protein
MDCRSFEERLDVFVAGLLPPKEQYAAEEHLSACARCSRLLTIVRGDEEGPGSQVNQDLLLSILHKTSGVACSDAALLLCDWVDGRLTQDDWEIISLHIDHCQNCRPLAASLQELKEVLPEMAEIEPDESLTGRILLATISRPRVSRHDRLHFDVREWWRRMLRRPRFAWEAAYVGALLILLALGNPAQIPFDTPKVTTVPRLWIQRGDQIVQETATALAKSGKTAKDSIEDLRLRSHNLLEAAAEYQDQTASALHREVTSILEELRLSLFKGNRTEKKQDLQ